MPGEDGSYALLGQILTEQGKLSVQMAVMQKTLESIPDHETRLRALERFRWSVPTTLGTAGLSAVVSLATWLSNHH